MSQRFCTKKKKDNQLTKIVLIIYHGVVSGTDGPLQAAVRLEVEVKVPASA
jgi:hypothetical protein